MAKALLRFTPRSFLSIFAFLLVLNFCTVSYAQRFTGKLILGINGAQLDGDGFGGFYRGGLLAGFGADFPINDRLSIGPEFLYSGKGSQVTLDQMEQMGLPRVIYKLNYIDIPIILTYKVRPSFRVLAGFSINYLLQAEIDNGSNLGFIDQRKLFNDFDYQVLAGMEYEVFDNIWLQGRWSYSALSINKVGPTSPGFPSITGQRGGYFNNLLQFSLRFNFGTGSKKESSDVKP